ncbi:MAG: collagen-like protein, partial [bacterium]|nr:collagen-like protein [bacterium]
MRTSLVALASLLAGSAMAAPIELSHQGRLLDSTGHPIDGSHNLDVALYDAP